LSLIFHLSIYIELLNYVKSYNLADVKIIVDMEKI